MYNECTHMTKVVLQVEDCAFGAPRDVQDQEFQGFWCDSRVVNFQWIRSPSSMDSSSEWQRFLQGFVPSQCSLRVLALKLLCRIQEFSEYFELPTVAPHRNPWAAGG